LIGLQINNRFTKCLIFLFKIPKNNKDFSHDITTFSFDEDMILKQKVNNNKNNKNRLSGNLFRLSWAQKQPRQQDFPRT